MPGRARPLDMPSDGFDSIEAALEALRKGVPVVVLDDEDRENEGDLIVTGDRVTEETMAFIVEHTSGVICLGMLGEDLDRLQIPLMIPPTMNEEAMSTAFTVTVDLREGTTTGISAYDRTATIRALADRSSAPNDFKRRGIYSRCAVVRGVRWCGRGIRRRVWIWRCWRGVRPPGCCARS